MGASVQSILHEESPTATPTARTARWLIWSAFVVGWTTALLTPQPVDLARQILPEEAWYHSFKLAHVGSYAVMTILSAWLRVGTAGRRWLLLFLCSHAFLTEFFQQFVPGRTASLTDVAIDHVGILLGLLVTRQWWREVKSLDP